MIVGKTLMALTLTIIQGINISSRKIRRGKNNGPERNRGAPAKSTKLYLVTGILDSPELPAYANPVKRYYLQRQLSRG